MNSISGMNPGPSAAAGSGIGGAEEAEAAVMIASPETLARDYTIKGDLWQPTGQDPQIVFEDCSSWEAVRVEFAEPIVNDTILTLYYSDGAFDRFHRAEEYLMHGTKTALVRVPAGSYDRLRLDIRTEFRLASMEAVPREPLTAAGAARRLMTGGGLLKLLLALFILWAGIVPKVKALAGKTPAGKTLTGETPAGKTLTGKTLTAKTPTGKTLTGKALTGKTPTAKTLTAKTLTGKTGTGKGQDSAEETCSGDLKTPGTAAGNAAGNTTGNAAGGRTVWLDALRALAAVMVVALHVAEPEALALPHEMKRYLILQALCVFCINCNLLFVLISGALLLPWREESFPAFLKKRVWKVVLPLLVYACFYVFGMCASADGPWFLFRGYVRQVSSDTVFMGPHLRLMYVIISLYLIAWFLRFLLKSMTEREEKILAASILVLRILATLALEHRVPVGVMFYLADWPGLFLMGYFLNREWMRKYDPPIWAAGIGAFAYSVYLVTVRDDFMNVVANTSSLMLFMSGALFTVFLRVEKAFTSPERKTKGEGDPASGACGVPAGGALDACARGARKSCACDSRNGWARGARGFVTALSRQSYSILLIHFFVLHAVLRRGLMREGLPMAAELPLMFLLCFGISWLLAFIVDNTVIAAIDHVLRDRENGTGKTS